MGKVAAACRVWLLSSIGVAGCGAVDTENEARRPLDDGAFVAQGGVAGAPAYEGDVTVTHNRDVTSGEVLMTPPGATPIPCAVQQAIIACQGCHGSTPIGGAPMPLVTHEDFARDYLVQFTEGMVGEQVKVYELARKRLNDPVRPMPPSGDLGAVERATLDAWLANGAPAGSEADRACTLGMQPLNPHEQDELIPEGDETCYELRVHAGGGEQDPNKYNIIPGEHYAEWSYNVPWKAGDVASRFGARFDNLAVLHHWLLYTDKSLAPAGSVRPSPGLTPREQLLAGWAIGGGAVRMPADVGLELPPPGTKVMIQWHFYNSTGAVQQDGSVVQVCTVPAGSRPHTASVTWLGTEALVIPPGTWEFSGLCFNDSGADITVVAFWPHMHRMGRNMRTSINGEEVFNKPFKGDYQIVYNQDPPVVIRPGALITSTCTFNNDGVIPTIFGPSTDQEMCYQYAFAYPAHALDNGNVSLNGASNVCW